MLVEFMPGINPFSVCCIRAFAGFLEPLQIAKGGVSLLQGGEVFKSGDLVRSPKANAMLAVVVHFWCSGATNETGPPDDPRPVLPTHRTAHQSARYPWSSAGTNSIPHASNQRSRNSPQCLHLIVWTAISAPHSGQGFWGVLSGMMNLITSTTVTAAATASPTAHHITGMVKSTEQSGQIGWFL